MIHQKLHRLIRLQMRQFIVTQLSSVPSSHLKVAKIIRHGGKEDQSTRENQGVLLSSSR
jgi:hypothetical protein